MGNIIDYARTETRDFGELPFREADALVLAQLSYDDVPECVPRLDDVESKYGTLRDRVKQFDVRRPIRSLHMLRKLPFNGVTIARADDELNHDQAVPDHDVENVGLVDPQVTHDFYHAVASNPRFSDIEMGAFLEQFDGEEQTQFAAVTYLLPSGALVVAYRGTDDSLVGWKEDFNMAFQYPVPAQATAADYLARVAALWKDVPIVLTGHSKGGNLAVYSGMKCAPFVQKRIQKIYSLDGPGFRPEVLKECHYNAIEGKVVKLLPHSSMIGMIFERDIHYRVVESNSHGLLQHDPFSWLVEEDHFVDVGDIYESQKIINEALNEWILSLNEEQVRTFVETLYQVISASQADDLITFTADWKKSMNAVVTALKEVDDQTAEMLRGIIRSLFEIAKVKVREELAPAKKPGRRFRNKKKEEKAEAHRPVPEDAPDATAAQGSAARHAPRLRGSRHRGSAE